MKPHVFIASSTFAEHDQTPLKILQEAGVTISSNTTKKRLAQAQLIEQARGAHGVIAGLEVYDAQVLEQLSTLRCISRCGIGVDTIDLTVANKKGITICTTPNVVIQPVVELTIAMMLNLLRRLTEHTVLMRQHQWQRLTGGQLAGKTVGVIGLGRIGRRVAEVLNQLGCIVLGYDIAPYEKWAKRNGVQLSDLNQVLCSSDIITLHISASSENPFYLGKQQFSSMRKGALIINLARGIFLDEAGLLEALQRGHLGGAGLDVFQQEPYSGPLCDLPNVILTPHVATLTYESRVAMEVEAAENIVNFFKKHH